MADNVVGIDIVARLDSFRAELAKIPDIGAAEAKALTAQLSKEIRGAEKAAKDAAKASKDAAKANKEGAKASRDAAGGLKTLKEAAGAVGYGDLAEKAGKFGSVLEALASPMGVAVGVAAGLALAVAGTTAALVASTFAADDNLKKLEGFKKIGSDFYPAIPDATLASIAAVNASTDAMASIWDRMVVVVGANVAPTLEKLTNTAVGLALEASDLFERWSKGKDLLADFASFVGGKLVDALFLPMKPLQALVAAIEAGAAATGVELPDSVQKSFDSIMDLDSALKVSAGAFIENKIRTSDLAHALGEAEEKGSAFVHVQERATKAMEPSKPLAMAAAYKAMVAAMDEDTAATRSVETALERLADAQRAATEAGLKGLDAVRAKRADDLADLEKTYQDGVAAAAGNDQQLLDLADQYETARRAIIADSERQIADLHQQQLDASAQADAERLATIKKVATSTADTLFSSLQSAMEDTADIVGKTNEDAAMKLWRISQAAALAQATLAALKGGAEAAAAAAPLGPIAAVAAGAITFAAIEGASVAKIAAESPPSFGDTPGVQRMDGGGPVRFAQGDVFAAARSPAGLRQQVEAADPFGARTSAAPVIVMQQAGSVVDERVTRFQRGAPSQLSRGLDRAAGNRVAKRGKR